MHNVQGTHECDCSYVYVSTEAKLYKSLLQIAKECKTKTTSEPSGDGNPATSCSGPCEDLCTYVCMYVYVPLWEGLTEEIKRFLKDPEWAAEASTAPGELMNKAHCCCITARLCFVQPLCRVSRRIDPNTLQRRLNISTVGGVRNRP